MNDAAGISLRTTQSLAVTIANATPNVVARGDGFVPERAKTPEPPERPGKPKSLLSRLGFGAPRPKPPVDTIPIERLTSILQTLKSNANEAREHPIEQAVLAVPAYYHDGQRMAIRDAATAAGWRVLRLINEPTAAALATGLLRDRDRNVFVFDLAPGRFDATVLKVHEEVFEVLATDSLQLTNTPVATLADALLEQIAQSCLNAMRDAQFEPASIDAVVPVGAHAVSPSAIALIESLFNQAPLTRFDPEEVTAIGAAVQAVVLANQ